MDADVWINLTYLSSIRGTFRTSKYKQFLTLNVRFFCWELQVNFRVQFNAKQSSKSKQGFLSVT